MQTYLVQKGDTLYGISRHFQVPIETIKKENNLKTNTISVGQELKIPSSQTVTTYTVKKNDTLYKIANQYNTTVAELIELNQLKTTSLSIGQEIKVPTETEKYTTYIVKGGDSLYSIARQFNVTIQAIKEENSLTTDLLSIGQILKIPLENTTTAETKYEVKSGDSLYSIAKQLNTTVEAIMETNNLKTTILTVGQILKIPQKSSLPSSEKECFGEGYLEPIYETYTVKKGDNLYDIARRYNTSVISLMDLNNLTTTNLQIGQILKVREL